MYISRTTQIDDTHIHTLLLNLGLFVEQGSADTHYAASRRAQEFKESEDNNGSIAGGEPISEEHKGRKVSPEEFAAMIAASLQVMSASSATTTTTIATKTVTH